jgi:hypothetical protein
MASISPAARSAALRLLARERAAKGLGTPADRLTIAEGVGRALATTLSRWFGPYGYHALLARALADALLTHPVLGSVRVQSPADPTLVGLADAATAHGIDATIEAVTAVLATTVDLLARLIGEELAMNLVEQAMPDVLPGGPKAQAEENLS